MSDDAFAFQVQRLTHRHRDRLDAATVAQVTLQQWLAVRHRFDDPFDPELFDHVDARLAALPASADVAPAPGGCPPPAEHPDHTRTIRRSGGRSISRSA